MSRSAREGLIMVKKRQQKDSSLFLRMTLSRFCHVIDNICAQRKIQFSLRPDCSVFTIWRSLGHCLWTSSSWSCCGFLLFWLQTAMRTEHIQYNLNGSNTDGSFTVDDSNSFFNPYKILPIAQENKYLGIFFLFYREIVCCVYSLESPRRGDSNEYTQHTIVV